MNTYLTRIALAAVAVCLTSLAAAVPVEGSKGAEEGDGWQSSYLNLKDSSTFKKGEKLTITVEGSAQNVVVRLLPVSEKASAFVGVEGRARRVPANRILVVTLERDHPDIKQISVHAGRSAWDIPLGDSNGHVKVVNVERSGP